MVFKSTKIKQSETITYHRNWTQQKTHKDDVRNPDSGFGQDKTCGGIKQTNGAPKPLLFNNWISNGNACINKREMDSSEHNDIHEVWKYMNMGQE
jgi:hypothetical protein